MALILWSKLENAGDVTAPQLGTGGAEMGAPTYPPARFNNGILSDINAEGCTFPTGANSINLDKGTIEFWAKMNYDETEAESHCFLCFTDTLNGGLQIWWSAAAMRFRLIVYSGGVQVVNQTADAIAWNVGDLMHFGLTWDRLGNDIGGGKTLALYIDNVLRASSITTWSADTVNANLYVGTQYNGTYHSDMVIDNIKTFDTCKIDFSDRNDEAAGANQAPTAPTSPEVNGESSPIGANCISSINPKFSAIYNDPDVGDLSNAIQIQVGSTEGLSDKWDSGWLADSTVEGNRCSAKTHAGSALVIGTSYWWCCRFRDDDNEIGDWSSWQEFEICAVEEPGGPVPYSLPYRRPFLKPKREPV